MMNSKQVLFSLFMCMLSLAGCSTQKQDVVSKDLSLTRAKQTLDSLYSNYSAPGTCLLRENYPANISEYTGSIQSTETLNNLPRQFSYLWPYSGTIAAVNALFTTTQDTIYKLVLDDRVLVGLEEYFDTDRAPAAYASYICTAPHSNRFFDDNIWLGIEFINIYLATNEAEYLKKAQLIWKFIESGMDNKLDGGIYWCEQKKNSKNTCSNAPASVLALKLFQATQDSAFLAKGMKQYEWTKSHLQDPTDNLYFDNIKLSGKVDKTKYAYNSGQMMQSAALLYKLTGRQEYLTDAQNIAKGCYNYFFTDYTTDHGEVFKLLKKGDVWFTAVMMRGYIELYQIDNNKTYLNSFSKSLDYAWEHARDKKGLFNTDFSGKTQDNKRWLLTQAAMVEMYARLAAIE